MTVAIDLCGIEGCRLERGHISKNHNSFPQSAWSFFEERDKKKVDKAGYATPRGGRKGAYQNHVYRDNKVIIPYEKLTIVPLEEYVDGYVIRLYPEQYFESSGVVKAEFAVNNVRVGENAFLLYRTHDSLTAYPPLVGWRIRSLSKNGESVTRRGKGIVDVGEYVLRIATIGSNTIREEGAPQGIFATEYANSQTNFLCQAILAWLITRTDGNPYTNSPKGHLEKILENEGLINNERLESEGLLKNGFATCPLCGKTIKYYELHEMINFEGESGQANSAQQVEGATRSTAVNLFHMKPLVYERLEHKPQYMAWGHANCNTRLGQRECLSLDNLKTSGKRVYSMNNNSEISELIGWINEDKDFLRSEDGKVWIRISNNDIQLEDI